MQVAVLIGGVAGLPRGTSVGRSRLSSLLLPLRTSADRVRNRIFTSSQRGGLMKGFGRAYRHAVAFQGWPASCRRPYQAPAPPLWSIAGGVSAPWIDTTSPSFIQRSSSKQLRTISVSNETRNSHPEPTIYALSSAPGRAAIAVIRVSGPSSVSIYEALCPGGKPLQPRRAAVRTLYEPGQPATRETILDSSSLLLYFPAPATATGEDILELHIHGGPAIIKAVLGAISQCREGVLGEIRYAEPGEFTRRAFMNNRLDLTQVEALGDTLSADTEQQRRLSVRGTSGRLANQYEKWRQQLLYARGELEALIDFSEDQHFDESPAELCTSVAEQVRHLAQALKIHSQNAVRGELLRNGIGISLLGSPNAGKSSLLNRIVGRQAAIVSNQAGTTRDIVEIGVDLGGYFCRFGDTAGLRKTHPEAAHKQQTPDTINEIELEGMRRAKQRAAESDLVIVVLSLEIVNNRTTLHLDPEVCRVAKQLIQTKNNVILVINKTDLSAPGTLKTAIHTVQKEFPTLGKDSIHLIFCTPPSEPDTQHPSDDPGNIQAFLQGLTRSFGKLTTALAPQQQDSTSADPSIWQDSLGASERHRVLLDTCVSHLEAFLAEVSPSTTAVSHSDDADEADIVVAAEQLRGAAECLAKITGMGGAGDVEQVLGVVFEKFCVGK